MKQRFFIFHLSNQHYLTINSHGLVDRIDVDKTIAPTYTLYEMLSWLKNTKMNLNLVKLIEL